MSAADKRALGGEIRRYMRKHHSGVLSTVSRRLDGYPFGSIVRHVLDHEASPVLLISGLAEHTRNMAADPRTSLLVHDAAEDAQTGARVTLIGDAEPVDSADLPAIRERYLALLPDAGELLELGDFRFMAIRPKTLRFIGGFGRIHWIAAEDYAPPANQLAECEAGIVAHMNADHAGSLAGYCRHYLEQAPRDVRMAGIDCDGIDLLADGQLLRIDFPQAVTSADATSPPPAASSR